VACAPSADRAVWACVEARAGARPLVHWLAEDDWTDRGAALRRLRRRHALHRRRSVALLPRGHYQLRQLDAPALPRAEWAQAVRWQLAEQIDFAVDAAAVDVLEIPRETSRRTPQLLAVAASHEHLRPLMLAAHDARTPWRAIDIAETALRNLGALVEPAGRAQALLHFQPDHGTLVITAGGELLATRDLDIGLNALADAQAAAREAAQDRAVLELQRTLDGFERQFTQVSLARLLAPAAPLAAFCAAARELIFVPVAPFYAAEALDLGELAADEQPLLDAALPAIGAALRSDA
jgi:MSHA biogenesis protein MshI